MPALERRTITELTGLFLNYLNYHLSTLISFSTSYLCNLLSFLYFYMSWFLSQTLGKRSRIQYTSKYGFYRKNAWELMILKMISFDTCNMFTEATFGNVGPRKQLLRSIVSSSFITIVWIKRWHIWPPGPSVLYMSLWVIKQLLMCIQEGKAHAYANRKRHIQVFK